MGGKAMTQGITTGLFVNVSVYHCPLHRHLPPGLKEMVTQLATETRIDGAPLGREYQLPANFTSSTWNLSGQRFWNIHLTDPFLKILLRQELHRLHLTPQFVFHILWTKEQSGFQALSTPDQNSYPAPIHQPKIKI